MPDNYISKHIEIDWYQHGDHDFQSAKVLFREDGYTDTIAVPIQQPEEKYLKGYLLSKGWKLKKTNDLELLIASAADYNSSFNQFLDFARIASAFYIKERYPPSTPIEYPREEIAAYLNQAEQLIFLIKGK
jgi:HEPN domain-containing protein